MNQDAGIRKCNSEAGTRKPPDLPCPVPVCALSSVVSVVCHCVECLCSVGLGVRRGACPVPCELCNACAMRAAPCHIRSNYRPASDMLQAPPIRPSQSRSTGTRYPCTVRAHTHSRKGRVALDHNAFALRGACVVETSTQPHAQAAVSTLPILVADALSGLHLVLHSIFVLVHGGRGI